MNWTRFQTYGMAPDKAFEVFCNQLFENWCKKEYETELFSFQVVNGAGGDGGVESYATLKNGDIIGLQAKWFLEPLIDNRISKIKDSIETAMKKRPNIIRYIVCVPRDLTNLTGKGTNTESSRWGRLVEWAKKEYTNLELDLWTDYTLTNEIQFPESSGINRYWFSNAELTEECFSFAFDKAKNSWLSSRYVPDLNECGKISSVLTNYLGIYPINESLIKELTGIDSLCNELFLLSENYISVFGKQFKEIKEILSEIKQELVGLQQNTVNIMLWLKNESVKAPDINLFIDSYWIETRIQAIEKNRVYDKNYFHLSGIIKCLKNLSGIDYYSLTKVLSEKLSSRSLLFLGNPGTGKTQGISSSAEQLLQNELHIPILIQARGIAIEQTWKDIIINSLGLSFSWEEDELWQALTATANRNRFRKAQLEKDIVILPKIIIMVDAIDESSASDRWVNLIKESNVITERYPQITFCFTSRPTAFELPIQYATVHQLGENGDVPVYQLFDKYVQAYRITVRNDGWLKFALNTPLALKLFCELNEGKTVEISNSAEVSMSELWRKKLCVLESEFCRKSGTSISNQYIFNSVVFLAKTFLSCESIERNNLKKTLQEKVSVSGDLSDKLIEQLESSGIIRCFRKHGTGITPDVFLYYPGLQGYFDYAAARSLIDEFGSCEKIDFTKYQSISRNTLSSLSILSIQNEGYLLIQNPTIDQVADTNLINELAFLALLHSNFETAISFKERTLEFMSSSASALVMIVNKLVLPLSRNTSHPLGASLLDEFLCSFDNPASRDLLWSAPERLYDSCEEIWYKDDRLNLFDEPYLLLNEDVYNGLPLVYAWVLSSVDNAIRKNARIELMKWASSHPEEYWNLFLRMAEVNDPQIRSDLFSILMCIAYDDIYVGLLNTISRWVAENILSPSKISGNRDISIRYYAIAIVRRACQLGIMDCEEIEKLMPTYAISDSSIDMDEGALNGTRMGGYKVIDYDLARYVLIDNFDRKFKWRSTMAFDELRNMLSKQNDKYKDISFEQFILSAAYAYILKMGWNEKQFYNFNKIEDGKIIGGMDCSILRTYHSATHGSQSSVMSVCEKYVWQARNYLSGYLSDMFVHKYTETFVSDYSILDDFIIPIQELEQRDPYNIPENSPWHTPEKEKVVLNVLNTTKEELILQINNAPNIDWKKWIVINNEHHQYSVDSERLLLLSGYSCFEGLADIETCLFMNSIIIPDKEIPEFIKRICDNNELSTRVMNPTDWDGCVDVDCYITPREICWFPWKNRYNCSNAEEFPDLSIESAVDKCTYNYPEYGDVSYRLPSKRIREILSITNTDGYKFWDRDKTVKAEFSIAGEHFETQQQNLLVGIDLIDKLTAYQKSLVWILAEQRRETGSAQEKYGQFYAEKRIEYLAYLKDQQLVIVKTSEEKSSS